MVTGFRAFFVGPALRLLDLSKPSENLLAPSGVVNRAKYRVFLTPRHTLVLQPMRATLLLGHCFIHLLFDSKIHLGRAIFVSFLWGCHVLSGRPYGSGR